MDALCINQCEVEERNQQVKLMASIYSGAEEVFICFDDDESVNEAFAGTSEAIFQDGQAWRTWKNMSHGHTEPMKRIKSAEVFKMYDFVEESWWNRVWTAQEFVLARVVRFHFFGDRTLSVDDVENFINYLQEPKAIEAPDPTIDIDAGFTGDLESLANIP